MIFFFVREQRPCAVNGLFIACFQPERPLIPWFPSERAFQRHKQGVIVEPKGVFCAEFIIFFAFRQIIAGFSQNLGAVKIYFAVIHPARVISPIDSAVIVFCQ